MNYNKYLKELRRIYESTGLKSDSIAFMMSKKYPEIKPQNFARWIRKNKVLSGFREPVTMPKVLFLDIETAPSLGFYWSLWSNPMQSMIIKRQHMIGWSAKWMFDSEIYSQIMTPKEVDDRNEKKIIKAIWDLVDDADIVVGHNAKAFDMRHLNARFIENGMPKPSSYLIIDTLKHCRKAFKWESYRLDFIGREIFGIEGKMETPKKLWFDAVNAPYLRKGGTREKQKEALEIMEEYNKEDIRLLEDVYFLVRPYINPHPNLSLFVDDGSELCPVCTSKNYETVSEYSTYVNIFPECRCKDCNSLFRMRKNSTPEQIKKRLTVSLPR